MQSINKYSIARRKKGIRHKGMDEKKNAAKYRNESFQ